MNEAFEPDVLVLYCGRSLKKGEHLAEGAKSSSGFRARFIMVPCSSKIETGYLVKLIEKGTDGVLVIGCPESDCQFLTGSARAASRLAYARNLLDEVGMGADRLSMVRKQDLSADQLMTCAQERANTVRILGQNPMRSSGI